ncbi:MAG TPA: hypothetical protein VH414_21145 [Lichenihabitans sp.]|jgi:hypothetical protein|nr:hypothetical protein [Lichenihabitans sp.]
MLRPIWGYVFRRAVMRDADRLMKAHGEGAHGLALIGARAARERSVDGHWSAVAREIVRRSGKITAPREVGIPARRSWTPDRPAAITRIHRP